MGAAECIDRKPLHTTGVPALPQNLSPPVRLSPAAAGEAGELLVAGEQLFSGYWGRPEATAEAFDARGFFRTGERRGLKGLDAAWRLETRFLSARY